MKRKIIPVDNDEAAIIRAADEIELRANEEAAQKEEDAAKKFKKS